MGVCTCTLFANVKKNPLLHGAACGPVCMCQNILNQKFDADQGSDRTVMLVLNHLAFQWKLKQLLMLISHALSSSTFFTEFGYCKTHLYLDFNRENEDKAWGNLSTEDNIYRIY